MNIDIELLNTWLPKASDTYQAQDVAKKTFRLLLEKLIGEFMKDSKQKLTESQYAGELIDCAGRLIKQEL